MMVLWIGSAADAKYSGGTGEPDDPYRIASAEDLNDIGNHEEDWNKHFILVNDVNLAQYTGTQFKIIGEVIPYKQFRGVFDGDGHKVLNFTWSSTSRNYVGLFGYVGAGGQIKNLGMENVNVVISGLGSGYAGGLVGTNAGTITDCYSTGSVKGDCWIGGLVGSNTGLITKCYSTSNVYGQYGTGGLVGFNAKNGMINWCYSTGDSSGNGASGGLVSWNESGAVITNCYSTGNTSGDDFVGGIVGYHEDSTVTNCYSNSRITADSYAGGLVGHTVDSNIINCYSTGKVIANSVLGGLVGSRYNSMIQASFWDKNTSGRTTSAGGTPKTTAEMKTKSTFTNAGWDFVDETANGTNDIWRMCVNGVKYPLLSWQFISADIVCPDGVDFLDFAVLASAWQSEPGDPDWNQTCDISQPKDSIINELDLAVLCEKWLKEK
jgi:hypothetical protein